MNHYIHTVQYYETDKMGITHHSNYIRWMEEARIDFLKQLGWDYDRLEAEGIISPVIGIDCKYLQSTTFADKVSIMVVVEEFKGVRLKLRYEMTKEDGQPAASGHSEHCFLNKEGRPIRLKKDFPGFFDALTELIEKPANEA